jgi:hypothetical protein
MKGDCKADTLYSCFNNWDPPLQGEDKDCSFVDGKKGVCKQVQQGFWDRFKGSFKDGCVAGWGEVGVGKGVGERMGGTVMFCK